MRKILFLYYIAFSIILLLSVSCRQNSPKYVEFEIKNEENKDITFKINRKDVKHVTLNSEKIFGLFTEILATDSLLICGNLRSHKLINIYSLNNGKLKNELIKRGESQNEGLSASNIYLQDNFLWIYDITLSRFFKMELNRGQIDTLAIKKIDLTKDLKNIVSPSIVNDNQLLSTTYSMDNFRYLYATPQNIIKKAGQLPKVKDSKYLSDVKETKFPNKAYIFKAISIKNSSENKIAVFYNKADRIEFYSNDKLIKIVQNQDGFSPIMEVAKFDKVGYLVEDSDKTKYAYLSVAHTEKYIYSLYSGNNETTSNRIIVFDWNGQFIKELLLDRKVCKIFVDAKNNILYCYEIQGNGIYSTNLNF